MKEVTIEEFKKLIENPNESVIFRYVDLTDEVKEYLDKIELRGYSDNYRTFLGYIEVIADEYSSPSKDINQLCFRFNSTLDFGYDDLKYYSLKYPNQIVKIIKPEKTMKTKIVKQLENQVQVMQSLLDGKMIVQRSKEAEEGGRFLKLESDNFTFLEKYPSLEDKKDWGETRVLPDLEAYNVFEVEEVEEQWYDNIPEHGVLCWVSDESEDGVIVVGSNLTSIDVIYEFDEKFFNRRGTPWNYATPLTNEEITKFLR